MSADDRYRLDRRRVRVSFDRAARQYDEAAVLQHEVCDRLLQRLDLVKLAPARILDLGAGTGRGARGLRARYRRATVCALDLSEAMLRETRRRAGWWRRPLAVAGDAQRLPFADAAFELIYSSLSLQWSDDLDATFTGLRRVLAPGGLFTFTTFGPDTLRELRAAWAQVDPEGIHVNRFFDMHDIGDALVRAGFADPVMDMEMITVTYATVRRLMEDLRAIGATNAATGRPRGLMPRSWLGELEKAYEVFRLEGGTLPATYEVVYGHAWAPRAPVAGPAGLPERFIPIVPRG
ncbi:MAG: malonyl-ACP O-methyltransferase BioC [Thioalkalivibrio sp.]